MAIDAKWLSSLEAGRRIVLCCFIVIAALATVCIKLYYDKNVYASKYEKIQSVSNLRVEKIQAEANAKVEKIQAEAGLKYEKFLEEQLKKTELLQQEYNKVRFQTQQARDGALKNNSKLKALIKSEQ